MHSNPSCHGQVPVFLFIHIRSLEIDLNGYSPGLLLPLPVTLVLSGWVNRAEATRRRAMPSAMVIDGDGETWAVGAPRLREVLTSCPDADADIVAYSVRNLGFVVLRLHGRTVRAEMHLPLVKPATLIAVYYNLLDLQPQQILLSRLSAQGASHEIFDDVSEFAATVERDIDDAGVQRHRPAYMLLTRPLEHLERARYARFAPIVALWRTTQGRLPGDLMSFLSGHGLRGRTALLRNPPRTRRLLYEHMGSSHCFVAHACFPLLLIGQDVEMLPDRDYGFWAARSYHICLADQEPRLETVSAVLCCSDGRRLWCYYDRMILPWRASDGTRFILAISEERRRMPAR
jgi:hypothetical protein